MTRHGLPCKQVAGAFQEFEKARLVHKLRGARDRASAAAGRRVEGRKPTLIGDALAMARRLRRRNPRTRKRRSLCDNRRGAGRCRAPQPGDG
jgi:hypothetical protein